MCGRFAIFSSLQAIMKYYKIMREIEDLEENYNVSPGQYSPVILSEKGKVVIKNFRWGLIPFWAKDEKIGYKLFNARAETISEKASFKYAFKERKCLIPVNGFYEWRKQDKQLFFIYLKEQEIFSLAGIWESWVTASDKKLETFSIITTEPDNAIGKIHSRMPVIIPKKLENDWLNSKNIYEAKSMLKTYIEIEDVSILQINFPINDPSGNKIIQRAVIS